MLPTMGVNLADGLLWYAVFLFSTVCHEAAHAWAALKLGDDTASRGGQVSLNPLPHLRREPVGMILVPIATWIFAGWLMGWASAPFNADWARRFPRRAAWMACAGPAANLALLLLAALLIRVGLEWHVFSAPYSLSMTRVVSSGSVVGFELCARVLSVVFSLNLLLFLFNLLPIPPLDGSSLPLLVLPENAARRYFEVVRSPFLQIAGLLFLSRGVGAFFPAALATAAGLLYPEIHFR